MKSNDEHIVAIYIAFEKRKALKKVKLDQLFGAHPQQPKNKHWYQFWKL
jgi:hypothetical protein